MWAMIGTGARPAHVHTGTRAHDSDPDVLPPRHTCTRAHGRPIQIDVLPHGSRAFAEEDEVTEDESMLHPPRPQSRFLNEICTYL